MSALPSSFEENLQGNVNKLHRESLKVGPEMNTTKKVMFSNPLAWQQIMSGSNGRQWVEGCTSRENKEGERISRANQQSEPSTRKVNRREEKWIMNCNVMQFYKSCIPVYLECDSQNLQHTESQTAGVKKQRWTPRRKWWKTKTLWIRDQINV